VCLHLAWWLESERNIVCSAHRVVSNYIPCGFYPETLKWHVPLCCANWTEEAQVKQRVAYGFSSLIVALEICVPLRALDLGNAWTAIIMDPRNGEDCYPLSGQSLWRDFTVKLLRRLPVLWQGNCPAIGSRVWLWDSILVIQPSNDSCAGRCSLWNLHSLKRLAFHGWYARVWLSLAWSNVREDMCYCREDRIADSRRQARNHEQWAGACSISCYVMPIRIVLLVMDTFGAGCCSRIQANVAFLTLSILLLV